MIKALLALVPPWAYASLLAVGLALGWAWHAQQVRASHKALREAANTEALKTQARQHVRLQEITDAETIKAREAESAAADLRAAYQRLRHQRAQRAPSAAGAASGSTATAAPGDLPAGLCDAAEARAVELAIHADAAHRAGRTCERAYDALTSTPTGDPS